MAKTKKKKLTSKFPEENVQSKYFSQELKVYC